MYKYFYVIMLLAAILLGIITIVSSVIGKRPAKIWRVIYIGLVVIIIVSMIGMFVTLGM